MIVNLNKIDMGREIQISAGYRYYEAIPKSSKIKVIFH